MSVMNTSNQEIDSLKIIENADGTFQMEWDKEDPKWSFLNNLTSKEIQIIVEQAIKDNLEDK
jgi:hypothetical protein